MGDFSFAGEHSSSYSVSLLRSPLSIFPDTREKVIVLPGRHGALRMIPDLGERTLQLECWIESLTMTQLHERLDRVRAWLNPLRGVQQLVFDDVPDRYYMAAYAGGGLDAEVTAKQGFFSLQMICNDPFAYALSPGEVMITASPYTHSQRGTAPADPLLRLQGVSTGAAGQQIRISIGAQTATYRGALATGEWLEIDSAVKTVTRVVGTTRSRVIQHMEKPVFPQLAPGVNTITAVVTGGATWSRLEVHSRNRWL